MTMSVNYIPKLVYLAYREIRKKWIITLVYWNIVSLQ